MLAINFAGAARYFSTGGRSSSRRGFFLSGGAVLATAGGLALYMQQTESRETIFERLSPSVYAATPKSPPQPSTYTGTKEHALYLWIHLKPDANARQCAKVTITVVLKIRKFEFVSSHPFFFFVSLGVRIRSQKYF